MPRAGETVTVEYRHRGADRETPPTDVQITVVPGVHPGTGAPAVYGFGIDISDLSARRSRCAQQAELRAVLAAFPGYIASVDEQMRYLFVNHALAAPHGPVRPPRCWGTRWRR